MEAKELRIGNYVDYLGNQEEIGLINDLYVPCEVELLSSGLLDIHLIKPIPLTEKWLLDFGFRVGKTQEYYELEFIEMFGYDNGDWNFKYIGNLIKLNLKHVHQLQNLYFALTGEELTINTPTRE